MENKTLKITLIVTLIILLLTSILIVYIKKNIKHLSYDEYIENATYSFFPSNIYSTSAFTYEDMFELNNYFINDDEVSIDLLNSTSEVIAIIEVKEKYLKGNGTINNAKVIKTIKGNIKEESIIKIYDLVAIQDYIGAYYLGGSVPMNINSNYIVFLKKGIHTNEKDTYIPISIMYGSISLSDKEYYCDYNNASMEIKDVMNYSFIFESCNDEEQGKYNTNIKNIKAYYGSGVYEK